MTLPNNDIVFIYGALRSGTTVFRLMLNAHPNISNPGEMDFLFDYLEPDNTHPTGWRYNIPKLSDNRIFKSTDLEIPAGLSGLDLLDSFLQQLKARAPESVLSINLHRGIQRVFETMPHVRVLHILRDPRDVARSSIQMGWAGTLYHGVGHWIATEIEWAQSHTKIDPSQIHEISYEGLFRDIDNILEQVCAFFQVPMMPEMLRYHENTTYGPPDASLTEQWKRKCSVPELEEVEYRAGPVMEQRGYVRSQPAVELGMLRKSKLALRNKIYVWRFGIKRFGAITYFAEKITRWLGLTSLNRYFMRRIQAIATRHLK